MEVVSSTNSPKAYDSLGGNASLLEVGSFIPFVVTRINAETVEIHFGPKHDKIVERATGSKIGAGTVVREEKDKLLMLPSHHKHGAMADDVATAVKDKLAQLLGEQIEIGQASRFKGKKTKK